MLSSPYEDVSYCRAHLVFAAAFVYGSIFLSKNGKLVIFVFSKGLRRSFLSARGEGEKGIPEFLNHIMASCSTDEEGSIPFDVCDEWWKLSRKKIPMKSPTGYSTKSAE